MPLTKKQQQRIEIQRDIEAFLRAGGVPQEIAPHVFGEVIEPLRSRQPKKRGEAMREHDHAMLDAKRKREGGEGAPA